MAHTLVMDFWQVGQYSVTSHPAFRFVVTDPRVRSREVMPCASWRCHGDDMERLGYSIPTPYGKLDHLQVTLKYDPRYTWKDARHPERTAALVELERTFEVGFYEGDL